MRGLSPLLVLAFTLTLGQPASASTNSDPGMPTIMQSDRGWVDTTNSVDQQTMERLRTQSDRIGQIDGGRKGFQLAGVFFHDIASDPSEYASKLGNQNGIGSSKNNNGIVVMVLLDRPGKDGHKPYVWVTAAGGLQGDLPDSRISDFENQFFVPDRANGHWQEGLVQLVTKLGDFLNDPNSVSDQSESSGFDLGSIPWWGWVLIIVVGIFVVVVIAAAASSGGGSGRGSSWGGGGWSSGGGSSDSGFGSGGSGFDGGGSGT